MIVIDTSVLIDSLGGSEGGAEELRATIEAGERLVLPTLVLYEWLRGPRRAEELEAQEGLLPSGRALAFGAEEARTARRLYRQVSSPRGREIDLAIAAHGIVLGAKVWTLNVADFDDIPNLSLYEIG